tara:strand:- start:711 stop:920 length:210 start_codon:yes stop_codon:yes gene_type:complete
MRIQFLKPLTNVGVYALTYPKNTGIPKFGMENALWVNIETGSDAPYSPVLKISAAKPVEKLSHIFSIRG